MYVHTFILWTPYLNIHTYLCMNVCLSCCYFHSCKFSKTFSYNFYLMFRIISAQIRSYEQMNQSRRSTFLSLPFVLFVREHVECRLVRWRWRWRCCPGGTHSLFEWSAGSGFTMSIGWRLVFRNVYTLFILIIDINDIFCALAICQITFSVGQ